MSWGNLSEQGKPLVSDKAALPYVMYYYHLRNILVLGLSMSNGLHMALQAPVDFYND